MLVLKSRRSIVLNGAQRGKRWLEGSSPMLIHLAKTSFPQRLRLSNGKLLDLMLWMPLQDALSRFTEVIDLRLPLEPDE